MGTGGLRFLIHKDNNFAGPHTVDYGLIMVEAKELRVFVYLLVFFPAIGFEPVESSMVFQRRSSNERPQEKKRIGFNTTLFPGGPPPQHWCYVRVRNRRPW